MFNDDTNVKCWRWVSRFHSKQIKWYATVCKVYKAARTKNEKRYKKCDAYAYVFVCVHMYVWVIVYTLENGRNLLLFRVYRVETTQLLNSRNMHKCIRVDMYVCIYACIFLHIFISKRIRGRFMAWRRNTFIKHTVITVTNT